MFSASQLSGSEDNQRNTRVKLTSQTDLISDLIAGELLSLYHPWRRWKGILENPARDSLGKRDIQLRGPAAWRAQFCWFTLYINHIGGRATASTRSNKRIDRLCLLGISFIQTSIIHLNTPRSHCVYDGTWANLSSPGLGSVSPESRWRGIWYLGNAPGYHRIRSVCYFGSLVEIPLLIGKSSDALNVKLGHRRVRPRHLGNHTFTRSTGHALSSERRLKWSRGCNVK